MTRSKDFDPSIPSNVFTGAVFRDGDVVSGFVFDANDPTRQLVVELLLDGWPTKLTRADKYDRRSTLADPPGSCHGFSFRLPAKMVAEEAEVRIANLDVPFANPLDLTIAATSPRPSDVCGEVTWEGGLRVKGWVAASDDGPRVRGLIAETIVFDIRPSGWMMAGPDDMAPHPSFDVHIPLRFADGKVHQLDVLTDRGERLAGSPLGFVAFDDGLERFVLERPFLHSHGLRGKVFDSLAPQSIPFAWLNAWLRRFPLASRKPGALQLRSKQRALVLFGDTNLDRSLSSLDNLSEHWSVCILPFRSDTWSFEPADLMTFVKDEASATDVFVFAHCGTTFFPSALETLAEPVLSGRAAIAYADVILEDPDGSRAPLAFGKHDPERLLEQGGPCHLLALSKASTLGAAQNGVSHPYGLFSNALEGTGAAPAHISGFLAVCPRIGSEATANVLSQTTIAYLEKRGQRATVKPVAGGSMPAVIVQRTMAAETISILLPARNRKEDLRASIEAIRATRSRHRIDVQILDMASSDEGTLRYLAGLRGQHEHVVRLPDGTSLARALNEAAGSSRSRFLCFLQSGCVVQGRDWFEDLVSRCIDGDVAAAGPVLMSSTGIVRCAGFVLGARFAVAPAFAGCSADEPGYADLLKVARCCSALPLPGLVVKRAEFSKAGGFDAARFGRLFHSVDLSLNLIAQGKRLVLSPHSRLTVPDRVGFWQDLCARDADLTGGGELCALRTKWGQRLLDDHWYNPALCFDTKPYTALAWPPRLPSLHADPSKRYVTDSSPDA